MRRDKIISYHLDVLKSLRSFEDLKIFYNRLTKLFFNFIGVFDYHSKVPPIIQIEPTNYCNVNCLCCPVPDSSRVKGFMSSNLFKKIIDEASKIGVKNIHFYLHGEPLLHPQYVDMLRYIKKRGLNVLIVSNGMLLNYEKSESILHSGINMNDELRISILGYSKEIHEKIMRGVNHEKVIKNILDFLNLKKKYGFKGPIIKTFFLTTPENKPEQKQFIDYWRKRVDCVNYWDASKSFRDKKNKIITTIKRNVTCHEIWNRMTIFWNGDVTICCEDVDGDYVLGNLNTQSLSELWNCEKFMSIRRLHKEKKFKEIPLCANCDFSK